MPGKQRKPSPQIAAPTTAPAQVPAVEGSNADAADALGANATFSSATLKRANSFTFTEEQLATLLDVVERTRETKHEHSVQILRDVTDAHAPNRFADDSITEGKSGWVASDKRDAATDKYGGLNEECAGTAHTHPSQGQDAGPLQRQEVMPSPTDVSSLESTFEGPVPSFDGAPEFLEMMIGTGGKGTPDVLIISSVRGVPMAGKIPMRPRPGNVDALAKRIAKHNPGLTVWYGPLDGPVERVTP